jgi:hypothetical protein
MGWVWPAPVAKAKADAAWPEGKELELGIGTWRRASSCSSSRSGRRRVVSGLATKLAKPEAMPSETSPRVAARRPPAPPRAAMPAAAANQSLLPSAARESFRIAPSNAGVSVAAIAA